MDNKNNDLKNTPLFSKSTFTSVNHTYAKLFGIKEAFWLSEIITWEWHIRETKHKEKNLDGIWFYYTQAHFEEKTGMSSESQSRIANKLSELGIIKIKRKGIPARNWYFIDQKALQFYGFQLPGNPGTGSLETQELDTEKLKNYYNNTNNNTNSLLGENENKSIPPKNWKKATFQEKFNYIHQTKPKILSKYLRFVLNVQEIIFINAPPRSSHYTNPELRKHVVEGCIAIDQLVRINNYSFLAGIKPCIKWALKDNFWMEQLPTLVGLRKKSQNNGEIKFTNIYDRWVKAIGIDPQKGRLALKKDYVYKEFG